MREMSASLISRLTSRPDKSGVKVNILLVDDEPNFLEYMKKGLNTNKYHVLTAANGVEALDTLRHQKVDLVITDVMMPLMRGLEQ